MVVLIPAYEPDGRLAELVAALTSSGAMSVVVVDDGSGSAYQPVFADIARLGAHVVTLPTNQGKGAALKAGFAAAATRHPGADVVCADCDGQHRIGDITRVALRLVAEAKRLGDASDRAGTTTSDSPDAANDGVSIVLGARSLTGAIPLKSRVGNDLTRRAFRLATGIRLGDTQTGLRAYPAALLPWLAGIPGRRFEYELEVLLAARRAGIRLIEEPIETIYFDGNESTHFRPVRDSVRVYLPLLRFAGASLASFVLDTAVLVAMVSLTDRLALSVGVARLGSAAFNYAINRRVVFPVGSGQRRTTGSAWRYTALAVGLLGVNYLVLRALTVGAAVPLLPAKILTELTLFLFSYAAQQRVVFARTRGR